MSSSSNRMGCMKTTITAHIDEGLMVRLVDLQCLTWNVWPPMFDLLFDSMTPCIAIQLLDRSWSTEVVQELKHVVVQELRFQRPRWCVWRCQLALRITWNSRGRRHLWCSSSGDGSSGNGSAAHCQLGLTKTLLCHGVRDYGLLACNACRFTHTHTHTNTHTHIHTHTHTHTQLHTLDHSFTLLPVVYCSTLTIRRKLTGKMLRSIQLAGAANTLPSVTLLSLARNPQRWWEDLLIIVARTKMRLVYPTVPRVLNTNLRVLGIATISQKIPFRLWSCEQSWQLSEGFFICHCIACLFRWIVRKGICVTWEYVLTAYHLFNSSPVALCRPRLWWKARAWGRCPGHDPKWRQEKASIYARLCRFVPCTCIVVGATGLQGAETWMQRSAHPLHSSTAEDVIERT